MANRINKKLLEKGTKIELAEHPKTIKKFVKKGVSPKTVARSIAREHLEINPKAYKNEKLPKKK